MIAAVPDTVTSGIRFSSATGSIASICVPSIEATTAVGLSFAIARSSAFTATSGATPVSETSANGLTPFGARRIASSAPLRWLAPSSERKPVIGTRIGMLTFASCAAAGAESAAASASAASRFIGPPGKRLSKSWLSEISARRA